MACFCVGIVPRDAIVTEESEHSCAAFLKPLFVFVRQFRGELHRTHFFQKSNDSQSVLIQVEPSEAEPVDGLDYGSEQTSKFLGNGFQFHIEWVPQQVVVHVAHQVQEAFLLFAGEGIVCREEVGDQLMSPRPYFSVC